MAISRNYQYLESQRPKLSRNIYDFVWQGGEGGNSQFASTGGYSSTTVIGGAMVDISVFSGCTSTEAGTQGLVPAPLAGQQDYFLQATGAWIDIPAYRWLKEFPDNSSTKTGLQIDGDFHVSNTLSAQTLRVEGSAHFWELVIDKARANGGQLFISPALFEVDYVMNSETNLYPVNGNDLRQILNQRPDIDGIFSSNGVTHVHCTRAYMRCDDTVTRTANEVEVGDMLRCKTFNIQAGVYNNVQNKDYWTFVVAISNGTVNYTTPEGEVVKCFWIDLADYLLLDGGGRVSFNSSLAYTGEITTDPDQTNEIDLTTLKRNAQQTYNGSTSVDTEYGELTSTIRNYVLNLYGLSAQVQNAAGNLNTRALSANTDTNFTEFELNQIQYGLSSIVDGTGDTYNDYNDAANLAGLILDGDIPSEAAVEQDFDKADTLSLRILGQNVVEVANELTPSQSAAITPSGMLRAPSSVNASSSSDEEYNWQTDPEYNVWQFGYGTFDLRAGDELASFGHLFDITRMNAIVISAATPIDSTLDAPSIAQYSKIDRFGVELAKFRTTALANNGNEFTGSFLVNHNGALMDVNEKINLFMSDLNTGLETVGIHLDGENSTIKLVGSVEIRQHPQSDGYDSLSVYDSSNNKKVEIIPQQIPALSELSNNMTIQDTSSLSPVNWNNTYSGTSIEVEEDSAYWINMWWWKAYNYTYTLKNASYTYTVSYNLGQLSSGDKLTIGSGNFNFRCPIYFNGTSLISDRSGQSIGSFYMYIKRGTTTAWSVNLLSNFSTYMPSEDALASDNISIVIPTNMRSQVNISTAGNYTVEFKLVFNFSAKVFEAKTSRYPNPTMVLNSNFNGTFNSTIERNSSNANSFMQIGTNGLAFNMGNNKFMYSSSSAMKFNWLGTSWSGVNSEGVGIEFSDTAGMKINRNVHSYSSSSSISLSLYDDVAIIDCSGRSSVTVYLPSASGYGKGRVLEIVTKNRPSNFFYSNMTISSATMKNHTVSGEVRTWENQAVGTLYNVVYWDGTFKFISDGSSWYEI